jgi:hypothetical protein
MNHVMPKAAAGLLVGLWATIAVAQPPVEIAPPPLTTSNPPPGYQSVYRLSGVSVADHLYTTDADEARRVAAEGAYHLDGVGFYVLNKEYKDSVPLYRFITPAGKHYLSTGHSAGVAMGARLEGPIGWVDPQPRQGSVPLYAWFHSSSGDYFYTTDATGGAAPQLGMQAKGIVCYVAPAS